MENISVKSEVISCENVKPSSPTPPHQQNYQLSMLDQISPPSLVPLVLYFPYDTTNSLYTDTTTDHHTLFSEKGKQLKAALSLTLTRFYPLAGRVSGNGQFIHCNDEGVPFSAVSIKGQKLSELLKTSPDPELWDGLFPCRLRIKGYWGPGDNVAMIQVNHFDCGGVAIAAVFWHKLLDAVTVANFFKYWAAIAKGTEPGQGPSYIGPSLFPPRGEEELQTLPGSSPDFLKNGKFVKRRYVFDGQDIQRLKAEASKVVSSPTRVEVVMALLWKIYMVASLANYKPVSATVYSVNLRRRTQPPLPSEGFGNLIDITAAVCTNRDSSSTENNANEFGDGGILGHLVKEVRHATSEIDNDYVQRMCGDQGFLGLCQNRKHTVSKSPGADALFVVCWCGISFYDVDFGWGKPEWLSISDGAESSSTFYNTVSLLDNKLGGVEAWVTLEETYMKVFDKCEELNNLASP